MRILMATLLALGAGLNPSLVDGWPNIDAVALVSSK